MAAKKDNSEEHEQKVSVKVLDYLQRGKCGDVVLVSKIDGRRLWAHRMVLSACSKYFEEIFMNKEATIEDLELEVDGKILGALMLYCYFGEICELEKIAEDLMVAAAQYLMQPVVDVCALYLADLEKSNCLQKLLLAERFHLSDLLAKAKALVCQHFMEVSKSGKLLQLTFKNVQSIIASDDLQVPCEEDVLNFVLSWLLYDWSNRQDHFLSLMEWIRLLMLPSTFLEYKIWGSNRECRDLRKLMEHHLKTEETSISRVMKLRRDAPRKESSAILILQLNSINRNYYYDLQSFCPQSNNWQKWSNLPDAICECGVVLCGRNLIIAGGYIAAGSKTLNTAYVQNLETKEWIPLSPMQMSRDKFSLVALNYVYAIGGNYEDPLTVERLDPSDSKNTWEYVAPLSCSRAGLAAAVLKGRLYVAGGVNTSVTNSVECYDPITNMWTQRAPMIYKRAAFTAVADNGYLYVLGGRDSTNHLDTVERYDPQANKWTYLCSLSVGQRYLAAAIIGNRIFAISMESDQYKCSLEEYNIDTDKLKLIRVCEQHIDQTITVPNYILNSTLIGGFDFDLSVIPQRDIQ